MLLSRPGWSRLTPLVCLLLLPACEPLGSRRNRGCGDTTTKTLDDLATAPSGFDASPAALLDDAARTYVGKLIWRENDGPLMVTPAGTTSDLEITVADTAAEVRLVEVELDGEYPNGNEGGSVCSSRLELDVEVGFSTGDGLFDEHWLATLRYEKHNAPGGLEIDHAIDFAAQEGTLEASDFQFDGAMLREVLVSGGFGGGNASGELTMVVDGGSYGGAGSVAMFSAAAE